MPKKRSTPSTRFTLKDFRICLFLMSLKFFYNTIIELDDVWSFVLKNGQKRWLWTAMCRRTRHIVAFVIGDRSNVTCLRLWTAIPLEYRRCHTLFWTIWNYHVLLTHYRASSTRGLLNKRQRSSEHFLNMYGGSIE